MLINIWHNSAPKRHGAAIFPAFLLEDGVDAAHRLDRERRFGLTLFGEDEELAPPMRPARCLGDRGKLARGSIKLVRFGINIRPRKMPEYAASCRFEGTATRNRANDRITPQAALAR